ncbi:CapA family protein [Bdellovibrio sp. HCB337]|uniref:CapA family protein n=1 Tax=Bdellovibrio sp. HCB337 TaxID=3394358 RepID=UPI0039A65107
MTKPVLTLLMGLGLSWNAFAGAPKLEFLNQCTSGREVTISGVGDILLHGPLQAQSFKDQNTFRSLWPDMIPVFDKFDISYANFEGPSAENISTSGRVVGKEGDFYFNKEAYTGYPMFNYHPRLVWDIVNSGIDIVSTANNHALDRRSKGADMTTEAMRKYNLPYTGTRPKGATNHGWHAVLEKNGLKIAFLACTFSTNGLPDNDQQVLGCYEDSKYIYNYVRALSQDPQIDAVIVTPHWGVEYNFSPEKREVTFGRNLIDSGATAVLGTHPHVIQPWEKYTSQVTGEEGLIVYSTGNFVNGNFGRVATQVGTMIGLKLVQGSGSNKLKIKSAKYLPLVMKRYPYRIEPIENDSQVDGKFSEIWKKLYPVENRITSLQQPFGDECN